MHQVKPSSTGTDRDMLHPRARRLPSPDIGMFIALAPTVLSALYIWLTRYVSVSAYRYMTAVDLVFMITTLLVCFKPRFALLIAMPAVIYGTIFYAPLIHL